MEAPAPEGVTRLLLQWQSGDDDAFQRLMTIVYPVLRQMARRCLRNEGDTLIFETTGLVNEAYLRLVHSQQVHWHDREHFFAFAARQMRRVLVDEARKRHNLKRGGQFTRVAFQEATVAMAEPKVDLIALDSALDQLARLSERKARVVELRFFAGLTIEETAAALGVSADIVKREWRTAKLWLMQALGETGHAAGTMERD